MPVMSGQELIQAIREYEYQENLQATPIIILSGESSDSEIEYCIHQLKVWIITLYIYRQMPF